MWQTRAYETQLLLLMWYHVYCGCRIVVSRVLRLWNCGVTCTAVVELWCHVYCDCGVTCTAAVELWCHVYCDCGIVVSRVLRLWNCGVTCTAVVELWCHVHCGCGIEVFTYCGCVIVVLMCSVVV